MITLICGIGKAGKTTYSKGFDNVVHSDLMGHLPYRYDNTLTYVRTNSDVVVEGIYNYKEYRIKLVSSYKGDGKRCIWLNTPKQIVLERMKRNCIPVSQNHFYFEPPTLEEGWDEIIIIRGDEIERISRQTET